MKNINLKNLIERFYGLYIIFKRLEGFSVEIKEIDFNKSFILIQIHQYYDIYLFQKYLSFKQQKKRKYVNGNYRTLFTWWTRIQCRSFYPISNLNYNDETKSILRKVTFPKEFLTCLYIRKLWQDNESEEIMNLLCRYFYELVISFENISKQKTCRYYSDIFIDKYIEEFSEDWVGKEFSYFSFLN